VLNQTHNNTTVRACNAGGDSVYEMCNENTLDQMMAKTTKFPT